VLAQHLPAAGAGCWVPSSAGGEKAPQAFAFRFPLAACWPHAWLVAPSPFWSVHDSILRAAGPRALPGSRSRPGSGERPGCLALWVLGREPFPSQVAAPWETHPLLLSGDLEMSPPGDVRKAPAGTPGGRDRGRSTDGMGKPRSGENELGRAEVPLIGTVPSNPAQSSLFTVAEREGRRKAAWQDAQSRSPSPPAASLSLMCLLAVLTVPGASERGRGTARSQRQERRSRRGAGNGSGGDGSPQPLSMGCRWGGEGLSCSLCPPWLAEMRAAKPCSHAAGSTRVPFQPVALG